MIDAAWHHVWGFWVNQLGGTFLLPGSTLSVVALACTFLIAAFLAVPRGRRTMPRLRAWRRALFPRRMIRSASGRADIAWFVFGMFFFGLAFSWAILSNATIAEAVSGALTRYVGGHPLALPAMVAAPAMTVILFLVYEFAYWFDHMLSHRWRLLWQFHRVHHAAESLSLLTNFRVHPVDTIVFYNIVAVMLGLAEGVCSWLIGPGARAWTIGGTNGMVMIAAIALTHLQHSHLWVGFGPRWGRWLLGPAHHQIHHSAEERHFDRNFGSSLAVWDRLFGTFYLPAARRETFRLGLGEDEPAPHGLHAAVVAPVVNALALLRPYSAAMREPSSLRPSSFSSGPTSGSCP